MKVNNSDALGPNVPVIWIGLAYAGSEETPESPEECEQYNDPDDRKGLFSECSFSGVSAQSTFQKQMTASIALRSIVPYLFAALRAKPHFIRREPINVILAWFLAHHHCPTGLGVLEPEPAKTNPKF